MVLRRTLGTYGRRILSDLGLWLEDTLGAAPLDISLYERALTHGSHGVSNYQRLEFLGDRVLGLIMAEWLMTLFPAENEGFLSHRFTVLVSGAVCAQVARTAGIREWARLGKQARDDGASDSDYILGDMIEGIIGALYTEHGIDAARTFIRRWWAPLIDQKSAAPRHPKSLLHEWAEAHKRKSPVYSVVERTGPDHAPRFRVKASMGTAGEAEAEGRSKQEAESAAAAALLEKLS
jgi:ribonuclease III